MLNDPLVERDQTWTSLGLGFRNNPEGSKREFSARRALRGRGRQDQSGPSNSGENRSEVGPPSCGQDSAPVSGVWTLQLRSETVSSVSEAASLYRFVSLSFVPQL